jgi:predicted Rossmann fold flavoprotein
VTVALLVVKKQIGIVGAGPAGMMAALEAAKRGARVLLFDTNRLVGRKLLVTGNGRCNLTNGGVAADKYVCADAAFLRTALGTFGREELLAALWELGVVTYATPDGWTYPVSDSAPTVVDAFAAGLEQVGVETHLLTKISDIQPRGGRFVLEAGGPGHTYEVDAVIAAPGGKAHPALGSKGELFPVLGRLGHTVMPVRPALAPIRAKVAQFHKLQGVRLDVGLAVYRNDVKLDETVGNLMFTQFGFSGPAAMDMSYLVSSHPPDTLRLVLNLAPYHLGELRQLLAEKRRQRVPLRVVLGAVLPVKIPPVLIDLVGLPAEGTLAEVSDEKLDRILNLLTGISVPAEGTRGFQFSQISSGGVPVTEVDARTMASLKVPNLYLAGEVMDVIGPCGGYNLQFAFTSGALAGAGAARAS